MNIITVVAVWLLVFAFLQVLSAGIEFAKENAMNGFVACAMAVFNVILSLALFTLER